jgi:hypothetical protein
VNGYDAGVSDDNAKTGPANPRTEGADVPTPPGGPQRADDPGETANVSAERLQEDLQRENAATSMEQPSDDSGGE